jgi:endoglucanase
MHEMRDFLIESISTPGLSGYEAPIRSTICETWESFVDELSTSKLGSLHGLIQGTGKEPRNKILLAAHMDSIGLMVTDIQEEFIKITEIGGIDPRVLPGQLVTIHGSVDIPGVVIQPPMHTIPENYHNQAVPLKYLFIDTGLSPRQIANRVHLGDLVSFANPPIKINDKLLTGPSLDNRASVAALTHALKLLQNRLHEWDVWAVLTVQEEETLGGAFTSAFELRPEIAIVIDVTFAHDSLSPKNKTYAMDKGPTLGWGPNVHPKLHKIYKELAERLEIPYQLEMMPRHSGTDAIAIQVAAEGVPTMVISIPIRYMHTPVEMVHIKDIERTGRLLSEFITDLDDEFMGKLEWE